MIDGTTNPPTPVKTPGSETRRITSGCAIPCRPNCSLSAPTAAWAWLLDDRDDAPPRWRLCWALLGLPKPLPAQDYRTALRCFAEVYGLDELLAGLDLAARDANLYHDVDGDRIRAVRSRLLRERDEAAA